MPVKPIDHSFVDRGVRRRAWKRYPKVRTKSGKMVRVPFRSWLAMVRKVKAAK